MRQGALTRGALAALALFLSALVLAACGGGDDPASVTSGPDPEPRSL